MGAERSRWITLNVGGTYFMTSRSTLTRGTPPSSPLHRISSNSTNISWDRDERGAFVIDRDPSFFQPVLNFLRYRKLLLNRDIPEEAVLLEAEYFNLPDLVREIKSRVEDRQRHLMRYLMQPSDLMATPFQLQNYQAAPVHSANHQLDGQLSLSSYVDNILGQKFVS